MKISSDVEQQEDNEGGKFIYFHFNEDDFLAIIEVNMREKGCVD